MADQPPSPDPFDPRVVCFTHRVRFLRWHCSACLHALASACGPCMVASVPAAERAADPDGAANAIADAHTHPSRCPVCTPSRVAKTRRRRTA